MSIHECLNYAVVSAVIGVVTGFGVNVLRSLYDTIIKFIS